MLVVIDANVIVSNPLLRGSKWNALRDAIANRSCRVVIPAVARQEAIAGVERTYKKKISEIKDTTRYSSQRAKAAAGALTAVYEEERARYSANLNTRIHELGIEVPEPPDLSHMELTTRATGRVRPFDDQGGGYRDTLIWLTALDQLDSAPWDRLSLVTADKDFRNHEVTLRAECESEGGVSFEILTGIDLLELPGEFESETFSLSAVNADRATVEGSIREALVGVELSAWKPHLDYVQVVHVEDVDLDDSSIQVRKRYGQEVYEVSATATARVEADVSVVEHDERGEPYLLTMSGEWTVKVRWQADTDSALLRELADEGEVHVLDID